MSDIHTINTTTGTITPPAAPRADITAVQTTAPVTIPWHQPLDNDIKTYALKKGYDLSDPVKAFQYAAKGHLEAEKFLGVPPQQLLRLPADVNDEAAWNAIYQRFGKPIDKSGYDFSKVKFADGSDLDTSFADLMREASFEANLPTTAAAALAQKLIGHMEYKDRMEAEQAGAKLVEEKAQLQKDWGNQFEYNRQTAIQGAQKLQMSPEDIQNLERIVGYSRIMEMLRKVGSGTMEDHFVAGQQPGAPGTSSAEQRLAQLENDPAWRQRFASGDATAMSEWQQLTRIISKYVEEAA